MLINMIIDYNYLNNKTDEEVAETLCEKLQDDIYSFSTGWRESNKYILKAYGQHGDYIVDWE